jgi:uncharacterized Zn-finger protein
MSSNNDVEAGGDSPGGSVSSDTDNESRIPTTANTTTTATANTATKTILHGKGFLSEVCDQRFTRRSSLNVHLKLHTGAKPFECEYCQKGFARKCSLVTHVRICTGEKSQQQHAVERTLVQCDICKRTFASASGLVRHKVVHVDTQEGMFRHVDTSELRLEKWAPLSD